MWRQHPAQDSLRAELGPQWTGSLEGQRLDWQDSEVAEDPAISEELCSQTQQFTDAPLLLFHDSHCMSQVSCFCRKGHSCSFFSVFSLGNSISFPFC